MCGGRCVAAGRDRMDAITQAAARVAEQAEELRAHANTFCERMVARGGGVRRVYSRVVAPPPGYTPATFDQVVEEGTRDAGNGNGPQS